MRASRLVSSLSQRRNARTAVSIVYPAPSIAVLAGPLYSASVGR